MKRSLFLKLYSAACCLLFCLCLFGCGNSQNNGEPKTEGNAASATGESDAAKAPGIPEEMAWDGDAGKGIFAFSTLDFDGNTVSGDIFADYDLTMINVWGTYCGPCIAEMPYLAELYNSLPENVNLIGVCVDGVPQLEAGKQIMADAGCTYASLLPDEALINALLNPYVQYIPSTIFVDSTGAFVSKVFVGVPRGVSDVAGYYQSLIDAILPGLA